MTVIPNLRKVSMPFLAFAILLFGMAGPLRADVIYNSLPNVTNSLGYSAQQTSQFGDYIGFAGTSRNLTNVTVSMSDFNRYSGSGPLTWNYPLTLNLYNVNNPGPNPTLGSLIFSTTVNATIPFNTDPNAQAVIFTVDFPIPNVKVPDSLIYGLSFNTQSAGPNPTGVPGLYNFLNFDLSAGVAVGTDLNPTAVFWNTLDKNNYTDLGAGGVGTFRQDTDWTLNPSIRFDATAAAVPEPSSMILMGFACAIGYCSWRRRSLPKA